MYPVQCFLRCGGSSESVSQCVAPAGTKQPGSTAKHHRAHHCVASTPTLRHPLVYSVHFCSETFHQLVRAADQPCLGAWVWSKCGQQCLAYLSCQGVKARRAMAPVATRASPHGLDGSRQAGLVLFLLFPTLHHSVASMAASMLW